MLLIGFGEVTSPLLICYPTKSSVFVPRRQRDAHSQRDGNYHSLSSRTTPLSFGQCQTTLLDDSSIIGMNNLLYRVV